MRIEALSLRVFGSDYHGIPDLLVFDLLVELALGVEEPSEVGLRESFLSSSLRSAIVIRTKSDGSFDRPGLWLRGT